MAVYIILRIKLQLPITVLLLYNDGQNKTCFYRLQYHSFDCFLSLNKNTYSRPY